MTTSQASFSHSAADPLDRLCAEALEIFKHATRQYALFHFTFFSIGVLELVAFILFFSFLTKTTIFAFSLAGLFLTVFSYFILLFYLQAKKPDQFSEILQGFVEARLPSLSFQKGSSEYHVELSSALERLFTTLYRQEYTYYSLPNSFQTLSPLMQKFSVWAHWKDLHQMKELILLRIIKERIALVKLRPTDLAAHAHLGNAYFALSKLHMDPRKREPEEQHPYVSSDYTSTEMVEKFRRSSLRALEEYKIVSTYASNDPWVYAQLAAVYCNLELPEEEMRAYEALLKVMPSEPNALFRLGQLCFEQGLSAKGLSLYEELKKRGDERAEALIACYGED